MSGGLSAGLILRGCFGASRVLVVASGGKALSEVGGGDVRGVWLGILGIGGGVGALSEVVGGEGV